MEPIECSESFRFIHNRWRWMFDAIRLEKSCSSRCVPRIQCAMRHVAPRFLSGIKRDWNEDNSLDLDYF